MGPRSRSRGWALMAIVGGTLVACSPSSAPTTPAHEPWTFGGDVPESITVAFPEAGDVVNSLVTAERSVVMVAFPGPRFAELVAFYDEELVGEPVERSETSIIAETEAVWMVRWTSEVLEVRVTECVDAQTRQFSQACVAVVQSAEGR